MNTKLLFKDLNHTRMAPRALFLFLVCIILCFMSAATEDGVNSTMSLDGDVEEEEDIVLSPATVYALCGAQCMAYCSINASSECDCWQIASRVLTKCTSLSCAKNCRYLQSGQEFTSGITDTPEIPSVDVSRQSQSVLLSWRQPGTVSIASTHHHTVPVLYVIQALKKVSHSDPGTLIVFNQTTNRSVILDNVDVCASYQFQVAAVGPYGTRGFSRSANLTENAKPGVVKDCNVTRLYYEDGYIKVNINCQPPSNWNSIKKYHLDIFDKKCNHIITSATSDSVDAFPFTAKIDKARFGCSLIELQIEPEPYTGCEYGNKTKIELDLSDCQKIENYPCQKVQPGSLPKVQNVKISKPWWTENDTLCVNITLVAPNMSSGFIYGFGVQWVAVKNGTANSFFPRLIPNTKKTVYFYKNQTTYIIRELMPDNFYQVKVGVRGYNKTIVFERLRSYQFNTTHLPVKATNSGYPINGMVYEGTSIKPPFSVAGNSTTVDQTGSKTTNTQMSNGSVNTVDTTKGDQVNAVMLALYITLPLLCAAILAVVVFMYCRYKKFSAMKHQLSKDREEGVPNIYISPKFYTRTVPDPSDRWEVSHSRIVFGEVLGYGAFGQVMKGKIEGRVLTHHNSQSSLVKESLKSQDVTVAIKMLHEYAEKSQKSEFLREIDLMKDIGHHPNVVSIIACCTIQDPLCLLVEHCEHGDLLNYLRKRRSELDGDPTQDSDDATKLMPSDLLSFARQIAIGMEFLSQKGFVHRDLAARNVLVADHKTVKIGDFGLTRYIYDDKIYHNKKGGKLPIKWMSVEAIFDQVFTTPSDVWSFGVVLFELVTIGGCPYPGMSNHCVVQLLKRGYRMEKPDNCSDNLYNLMLHCWREKPRERPTFTDLRKDLEILLEQDTPYLDFNLDENKDYYKFSSSEISSASLEERQLSDSESNETDGLSFSHNALSFTVGSSSCSYESTSKTNNPHQVSAEVTNYDNQSPEEIQPLMVSQQGKAQHNVTLYDNQNPEEIQPFIGGLQCKAQQNVTLYDNKNHEEIQPLMVSQQRKAQQNVTLYDSKNPEEIQPFIGGQLRKAQQNVTLYDNQNREEIQPFIGGQQCKAQQNETLYDNQSPEEIQPLMVIHQEKAQQNETDEHMDEKEHIYIESSDQMKAYCFRKDIHRLVETVV